MPMSTSGDAPPPLDGTSAPAAPLRCFLVEDNALIRENLIATLQELLALEIVGTAADEQSAIDWMEARRGDCDLIIIDILLKTGTGFAVLNRAKTLLPAAKCVVLTNFATPEIRRRCRDLGADAFFDKSAELEQLIEYCAGLS